MQENENEIPESILNKIRKRSNRSEQTRFPYKIFSLLEWAGKDEQKSQKAGCGWITDTEFFINKSKLCEVLGVKINTLNVNLKTLGFVQTRQREGALTFYRNDGFVFNSENPEFDRIRNSRCKPEALLNMKTQAVYLPCLEPLMLFMMDRKSINIFKKNVISIWEKLVGANLIFAISMNDFKKAFQSLFHSNTYPDIIHIEHNLPLRVPKVVDIFDFAVFLARFGPFESLPTKIQQFQSITAEFYLLPNTFSSTFHNCFVFPLSQIGEYHCYNLPLVDSNAQFLADEDCAVYPSWSKMFQQNQFLSQT